MINGFAFFMSLSDNGEDPGSTFKDFASLSLMQRPSNMRRPQTKCLNVARTVGT